MRYIMIRCVMFVTLFAGFNNLCMESNEENNKEQSPLDNELKQVRQEHAKRYQREKEKKEAEYARAKNKKLNKKKQQSTAKPAKDSDGKEEVEVPQEQLSTVQEFKDISTQEFVNYLANHQSELKEQHYNKDILLDQIIAWINKHPKAVESQVPSERWLTQEGQTELFAKAKQAIALVRAKKPDPQEKKVKTESTPAPTLASIFQFLHDNKNELREAGFDTAFLEQAISLINNNKITIASDSLRSLLLLISNGELNSRIFYSLLRNGYGNYPYNNLYNLLNIGCSISLTDSHGIRKRNILSAVLLFVPFALSRATINNASILRIYYDYVCGNNPEDPLSEESAEKIDMLRKTLVELKLCNSSIGSFIKRLELSNEDSRYLSITTNVNLIRIILFLATYTYEFNVATLQKFIKEQSSELTGNEVAPDGTTALMFAVGGGYWGIVKELLRRGANPFLMNNHGDNAFSIVEMQLERAQLQNDSTLIEIYTAILQLLLEKQVAQLIRALQSERQETLPNGTAIVVPALPWELALRIALASLSTNEQRMILRLLNQFPADRLFPLVAAEPVQQEMAGVPQMPGFSHYLPAWIVALLSYSILSFAHKR